LFDFMLFSVSPRAVPKVWVQKVAAPGAIHIKQWSNGGKCFGVKRTSFGQQQGPFAMRKKPEQKQQSTNRARRSVEHESPIAFI
jgi:hypothetical protein